MRPAAGAAAACQPRSSGRPRRSRPVGSLHAAGDGDQPAGRQCHARDVGVDGRGAERRRDLPARANVRSRTPLAALKRAIPKADLAGRLAAAADDHVGGRLEDQGLAQVVAARDVAVARPSPLKPGMRTPAMSLVWRREQAVWRESAVRPTVSPAMYAVPSAASLTAWQVSGRAPRSFARDFTGACANVASSAPTPVAVKRWTQALWSTGGQVDVRREGVGRRDHVGVGRGGGDALVVAGAERRVGDHAVMPETVDLDAGRALLGDVRAARRRARDLGGSGRKGHDGALTEHDRRAGRTVCVASGRGRSRRGRRSRWAAPPLRVRSNRCGTARSRRRCPARRRRHARSGRRPSRPLRRSRRR